MDDPIITQVPPSTGPIVPPASDHTDDPYATVPPQKPKKEVEPTASPSIEIKTTVEENAPQADKIAKEEGDDYWENYAREIEIEKELEAIGGVERIESGEVKVPPKLAKEMGIKPAVTEQTAVSAVTDFKIRGISLSDDQVTSGLTKPTSKGLRWLVEWFIYQLLKAHFIVKKIKGKIIRSKKND